VAKVLIPAHHRRRIEYMFDRVEVAEVREAAQTKLDDLAWLCRQRRLKTHQRWQLDGPPGNRQWRPPTPTRAASA
jgi:hypothetical protein